MIDVEAYDFALGIEIDDKTLHDFMRLNTRSAFELDIETVCFRMLAQLHRSSSTRNLRSKNALWTVSPSSKVTTRRMRGSVSSAGMTLPQ